MTYHAIITKDNSLIFAHAFNQNIPLLNRRHAIRRMKEVIEVIKTDVPYSLLEKLPLLQLLPEATRTDLVKNVHTEIKQCVFSVFAEHEAGREGVVIIESSIKSEEELDLERVVESSVYKQNGWNTSGELIEVFITMFNAHSFILADNLSENIGLRELLNCE